MSGPNIKSSLWLHSVICGEFQAFKMCITQRAIQSEYTVTQVSEMYILRFYVCLFEWLLDIVMEACNTMSSEICYSEVHQNNYNSNESTITDRRV